MYWLDKLDLVLSPLAPWNYIVLAFLAVIEGPAVTLIFAAMATTTAIRLPWVFVAASAGNLAGDSLWYLLGYTGKMGLIYRIGERFGVKSEQIRQIEDHLQEHAVKGLVVAKLTAGFVIPSLIVAGLLKVPMRKWFLPIVAVELVWTGALVLLGYYATAWIAQIEQTIQIGVGVAMVVLAIGFLFWLRRR